MKKPVPKLAKGPTEFSSLSEYVQLCRAFSEGDRVIYRGQSIDAPLLPGIARAEPSVDHSAREREVLRQLAMAAPRYSMPRAADSWGMTAYAQHYGLRTRLLDWTWNPNVALWFGVTSAIEKQAEWAYVYMLRRGTEVDMLSPKDEILEIQQVWIVDAQLSNPRIQWQAGCFTAHPYSVRAKKYVSVQDDEYCSRNLAKFEINRASHREIIESLDCIGVNSRSIYPDEFGLMSYLNWRFISPH